MGRVRRCRSHARWLIVALALACDRGARRRDAAAVVAVARDAAAPADAGPPPARRAQDGATADDVRAACEAFLGRWLAAQNDHDWDAYQALYDPKHFKGVRRVHGHGAHHFDHDGWMRDRKRMVLGGAKVAAELDRVETWLDPGSTLA